MRQLFTALFVCFFLSSALAQSTVYVTQNGAGDKTGTSWSNALPGSALQYTLASAISGTQFWIANGTYYPSSTYSDRNLAFFIPSGVLVYGGFSGYVASLTERVLTQPSGTVFSGEIGSTQTIDDNSIHVVTFKNASAGTRLDGVTILRGNGPSGGGIYNDGSGAGGRSEPVITNCYISANTGYNGGGIFNNGYQGNASPTITNCILSGNLAYSNGGGIYNNGYQGICNPKITNCLSFSNTARDGGAYYNEAFQGTCNPVLLNCTIAYNRTTAANVNYGSGSMYNDVPQQGSCAPVLKNCILWGNTADSSPGTSVSIYNNGTTGLSISYSDTQDGYAGTGNISQDPRFSGTRDFHLPISSPVVDAGDPASTLNIVSSTDLDGKIRIISNRIDMGAYECSNRFGNGKIVFVTPLGAGDQSGTSWDNALPGIQLASVLPEAAPGTSFWLAEGQYKPTTGNSRVASFFIPSGVQVYGSFKGTEGALTQRTADPTNTILSGDVGVSGPSSDNSYHVVTFRNAASSTRLDGLAIKQGNDTFPYIENGAKGGGGIYNNGSGAQGSYIEPRNISNRSNPTISNCYILSNRATFSGGGIYNDGYYGGASPALINCVLSDNESSRSGGAMYNELFQGEHDATALGCFFTNNRAESGGAVASSASYNSTANQPQFTNCYFGYNSAIDGGCFYISSSFNGYVSPSFTNCVFTSNKASRNGSVIAFFAFYYSTFSPSLTNCTLASNIAGQSGGTIYASLYPDAFSRFTIKNSILRNFNTVYNTQDQKISPTYTITYSNVQGGFPGTGNIDADPQFINPDPTLADYHLRANSPSINTGDPNSTTATVSATDFDGNFRIEESRIDMGAYELQLITVIGADLSLNLSIDNRTPLVNQAVTYQLTVTNEGPRRGTNITWKNRLPATMKFVDGNNVSQSDGVLSGFIPALEPNESATFSYKLQPTQSGQYINAAQIWETGTPDPDSQPGSGTGDGQDDAAQVDIRVGGASSPVYASANPNQVPLPPVQSNQPTPDLSKVDLALSISVDNRVPKLGDLLTYVMTITNQGGATASNVRVTAYLPDGQEFAGSGDGLSVSDGGVSGGTASIPAGGQVSVRFTARVTASKMGVTKAQIRQASPADVDSTPDNGTDNGEDDTAQVDLRSLAGS